MEEGVFQLSRDRQSGAKGGGPGQRRHPAGLRALPLHGQLGIRKLLLQEALGTGTAVQHRPAALLGAEELWNGRLRLHVIGVVGTHMKDWGVDGLSRGNFLEGFLALHGPTYVSSPTEQGGSLQSWHPAQNLAGWMVGRLAGHQDDPLDS